jgi:hypothetical protein
MISHISSYHASADRALHIFADRCTSVSSGNTIVFICRFLSFFCLPHCSWCYFLKFTINLYFSLYEMLFTLTFCKILYMVRERITPVGCRGCRRLRSLPSTPDEGCSCLHLHLHYWSNTNKLINCKFMNFYFVFLALILLPSIHITCY